MNQNVALQKLNYKHASGISWFDVVPEKIYCCLVCCFVSLTRGWGRDNLDHSLTLTSKGTLIIDRVGRLDKITPTINFDVSWFFFGVFFRTLEMRKALAILPLLCLTQPWAAQGLASFDPGNCNSTHPCWYTKKDSNIICNVNAKTRVMNSHIHCYKWTFQSQTDLAKLVLVGRLRLHKRECLIHVEFDCFIRNSLVWKLLHSSALIHTSQYSIKTDDVGALIGSSTKSFCHIEWVHLFQLPKPSHNWHPFTRPSCGLFLHPYALSSSRLK